MCGIAGEARWTGAADAAAVDAMVSRVAHRGPDDRGLWTAPDGACALGHARLAIVDLSPAGHQPMVDPSTGNALVFNGEIYNHRELRATCERDGDAFRSQSDTEVILALYRRHGLACLRLLRGMFAIGLWDAARRQLVLARDRLGKKPLVYAATPSGVAFCSELDALARLPGIDDGLDAEALELYLQCQYVPSPWTIFRGIRKLPPAHYAVCDGTGMTLYRYWDIDYRDKLRIGDGDALDALEERLTEAVRLRMLADVPVGAMLSGGVDSSVVVALMAKLAASPVRTFSIGFPEAAFDELPWARQAAQRCGTLHHPEVVRGDVAALLPTLARHYGEPYADDSAVPSFLVCASLRRHVTVALNGDGGDELLGGYERYRLPAWAVHASTLLGRWAPPARLARLAIALQGATSLRGRALRKLLMQGTNPELRSVTMYGDYWQDAARRALFPGGDDAVVPQWRERWLAGAFAHADNAVDRMLWLDSHTYLPDCLLAKMDIASMHCGLETRSPLLDHEVVEFCARLPVRVKVRGGDGKVLLKQLAERHYPAAFVRRRKQGFAVPLASWLRGPLHGVLRDTLHDAPLMAPLSAPAIAAALQAFENGDDGHRHRLWALLMFGAWRRQRSGAAWTP
ncbi:MAG TPA: asparagine synthase (glutamine-hydrolyzing) [Casimicrobiaceae bacterium]|nr:asparagine synthase (glutamine-hydrolyzing) [Casimicrobiaceae bacterium]